MTDNVIIIGGGIAGLTAAWRLTRSGHSVVLLEANEQVGGVIQTASEDGFLKEWGPNSFLGNAEALLRLATELGLSEQIITPTADARARYIFCNSEVHLVPQSPGKLLSSKLLSWRGKWQLAREAFVKRGGHADESVADFVRRRMGQEILDRMINPLMAGIYAGDPEQLNLATAFPKMAAMEQEYGSLIRAAIKSGKGMARSIQSFRDGMATLPRALADQLGDAILTGATVTAITRDTEGYAVHYIRQGVSEVRRAKHLLLATPAPVTARLLESIAPTAATALLAIPYAPVVIAHAAYDAKDCQETASGFGCLIPEQERRRTLGFIYSSALFPNRARDTKQLFTAFLGGARDPHAVDQSDTELARRVALDAKAILGIRAAPVHLSFHRKHQAIPQYTQGHRERVAMLRTALADLPGLHCIGNYLTGTSVNDTIVNAETTAATLCQTH